MEASAASSANDGCSRMPSGSIAREDVAPARTCVVEGHLLLEHAVRVGDLVAAVEADAHVWVHLPAHVGAGRELGEEVAVKVDALQVIDGAGRVHDPGLLVDVLCLRRNDQRHGVAMHGKDQQDHHHGRGGKRDRAGEAAASDEGLQHFAEQGRRQVGGRGTEPGQGEQGQMALVAPGGVRRRQEEQQAGKRPWPASHGRVEDQQERDGDRHRGRVGGRVHERRPLGDPVSRVRDAAPPAERVVASVRRREHERRRRHQRRDEVADGTATQRLLDRVAGDRDEADDPAAVEVDPERP